MSGVIVGNDVDVEIGRALLVDQFEKGQPFLMTMARREMGDQLAVDPTHHRATKALAS